MYRISESVESTLRSTSLSTLSWAFAADIVEPTVYVTWCRHSRATLTDRTFFIKVIRARCHGRRAAFAMDARTTASPQATDICDVAMQPQAEPDKISAYYSLVFPNFTYYLQTLSVTIGRRCNPTIAASSSDLTPVDVDLGPLKSVSRLHARIEYEEEEERFVLVVIGRNGAWVDGVWSGSGSKVFLSERWVFKNLLDISNLTSS
jgi:hypothetical protein